MMTLAACSSVFNNTPTTFTYRCSSLSSTYTPSPPLRPPFSSCSFSHHFLLRPAVSAKTNDPDVDVDDGCDLNHWLVVMDPPLTHITRDEIIATYIKTLATVLGSERDARMKIYSVSTRHYYAFGAQISQELSYKVAVLKNVRYVLPHSYLDANTKDYGGEPFINGEAVPYDPKYHKDWTGGDTTVENDILWLSSEEYQLQARLARHNKKKEKKRKAKTSKSAKTENKSKN